MSTEFEIRNLLPRFDYVTRLRTILTGEKQTFRGTIGMSAFTAFG